MKAEYKRDMNHNYLILKGEREVDTASYQMRMLVGNSVPSLLKCRLQGVNGELFVCYDVTSRQTVASLFEEGRLGCARLELLFGGFVQVMEEMSEYLLNPEQLVLLPEYMYVDAERKRVYFCYLPGYERDMRRQFQELTEYVLPKLDHQDIGAVMLGYGVYRRALEDSFHLEHIKEELFRGREEPEEKEAPRLREREALPSWEEPDRQKQGEMAENPPLECEKREEEQAGEKKKGRSAFFKILWRALLPCAGAALGVGGVMGAKRWGYLPQLPVEAFLGGVLCLLGIWMLILWTTEKGKKKKEKKKQGKRRVSESLEEESDFWGGAALESSFFREEQKKGASFWGEEEKGAEGSIHQEEPMEETVVLYSGKIPDSPMLVSQEPGELQTIYLREDLTVIGKLENAVDAAIHIPTVSRIHARIRRREGLFYLSDLNSRNGTFVNGQPLLPDEEYCLKDQDQIDFAQAKYIYIAAHPPHPNTNYPAQ